MESTRILVGILGLQVTIAAGMIELIEQFTSAAEGFWIILMLVGILITASAFGIGRASTSQ
ncbi:hypothetical protein [Halopiger goleimassiliensis]|uniref:hypothetical protein n=1 Tax=Halopiger goleimassiliensis TaxID=1293048 RepID=UPI000677D616|nr:hypothetical protein [Halopiger goleimassiliensis]